MGVGVGGNFPRWKNFKNVIIWPSRQDKKKDKSDRKDKDKNSVSKEEEEEDSKNQVKEKVEPLSLGN